MKITHWSATLFLGLGLIFTTWQYSTGQVPQRQGPVGAPQPVNYAALAENAPARIGAQDPKVDPLAGKPDPKTPKPDKGASGGEGAAPDTSGGGGEPAPEKPITATLGQRIHIRPVGFKGQVNPANVVIDRPDLFSQTGGDAFKPFTLLPGGTGIQLIGVRLGQTKIRIFNPDNLDKPYVVQVVIIPDIRYLNWMVQSRFPMSNLVVTAGGDNFLFVDGHVESPADVEAVEDLLKKFFVGGIINNVKVAGVMQVQLEVVIARIDRTHLRQFGVNILANNNSALLGTQIGNLIATPQALLQTTGAKVFQPIGPNQPTLTSASTAFFGISDHSGAVYGFIEALRQNNLAKVLANPTLVTFSGRQADFLVGGEQPIPVSGTITAPTVTFKPFGTRLTFLPTVLGGGKIRLDVVPEVSTTDFTNSSTIGGLVVPQFIVQRLHATVELQAGQTLCLGGLLQSMTDAQTQKVPFLGELPGVGAMFRRTSYQTIETELLVLVTPRLFNPLEGCDVPKLLPGQQTFAPTDAQFFGGGALESTARDGGPPFDKCHPPQFGDLLGQAALPAPITMCRPAGHPGAYQNLLDSVCPSAAPATGPVPISPPGPVPTLPPSPEPASKP